MTSVSQVKKNELYRSCEQCGNNTFNVVSIYKDDDPDKEPIKHEIRCVVCETVEVTIHI